MPSWQSRIVSGAIGTLIKRRPQEESDDKVASFLRTRLNWTKLRWAQFGGQK